MRRKAFILILLIPFFLNGCMVIDFINEKVFGVQTSPQPKISKELACCNCNSKNIEYPPPKIDVKKYKKSKKIKKVVKRKKITPKKIKYSKKITKNTKKLSKKYKKITKKENKKITNIAKKEIKKEKTKIVKIKKTQKKYIAKTKNETKKVAKKVALSKPKIQKIRNKKISAKKFNDNRKKLYAKVKKRYKVKRKYKKRKRLAYEPFSINKNCKDPELLGPQTTIKANPLSKL